MVAVAGAVAAAKTAIPPEKRVPKKFGARFLLDWRQFPRSRELWPDPRYNQGVISGQNEIHGK